jgi:hypothetical protein
LEKGVYMMSAAGTTKSQDHKVIGEWRINWVMSRFFIMHAHGLGTPKEHWDMCVKDESDKKGILFTCRVPDCNTKVPGGIVAAALTRKLSEALQS